jgi:hypothetical protein
MIWVGSIIIDLRTELGICNLRFLRNAVYTGSEAGKLILMSLKYSQIEAGVSLNLLEHTSVHLPYLTPTWLTSVRQFLYQHNITVNLTDTLQIRLSNNFDRCIMETADLQRYTPGQQHDINLVRLYIQALDGCQISLLQTATLFTNPSYRVIDSRDRESGRTGRGNILPSNAQRRLWRKFIQSTYLRYGLKWRYPLGPIPPKLRPQPPRLPCIDEPLHHDPGDNIFQSERLHYEIAEMA